MKTTATVTLEISDDLLPGGRRPMPEEVREYPAVGLYDQEEITLVAASEPAGMSYFDFWQYLARFSVGPSYDLEDLEKDAKALRELAL